MTALRYAAARLGAAVLVVWGAATCAFLVLQLVPGDPVHAVVGSNALIDAAQRKEIEHHYGLDRALPVQYVTYLGRLLRGDLGDSYQLQQPVAQVLGQQVRPTAELALFATLLAVVLAVAVTLATSGRARWPRRLSGVVELVVVSTPSFWLGIMLLTLFSFRLGWLPVSDSGDARSLVLPVVTLALPIAAVLTQVMREGLLDALRAPFVLTARARGLTEPAVRARHALRHAALPALTLAGWFTGTLLSGAVVVENVFARPGIGRVTLQAVTGRDLPLVQGVVTLSALVFVGVGAVVEVLALVVDPRLRTATGVAAA
ncbi:MULTISPECIES: ABC transporter permease [Streptomyces]|uniref:ABC transporter permease n=1 Tax=Streptomyces flaveolus TaxID=67297 RepID=A0ABV3AMD7_9ACTN|nr:MULTISPECIES: ABC transporter permease [Streptomyces]KMS84443.1 ABC transporter permease [Streptomyces regensis]KOG62342.1 ABC transporter permease [Streptomyces antibioticus]KOV74722.1 ABC transporter permease [Streptomyces sp. NRRL WC-3723]